jgi:threonine/homoserine/homoserine lactone efflux protein
MARSIDRGNGKKASPPSFLQATALQWVNPKGWVMAVTAAAVYTSADAPFLSVFVITLLFFIIMIPPIAVWAGFGITLRGLLSDPLKLKWFNIAMGILLAATIWPILAP